MIILTQTKDDLKRELVSLLEEKEKRLRYNKRETFFPEKGKYRAELYPKHLAFLAAGATYRQRAFIAGNRVGKTAVGAYEMSYHLTGSYPQGWKGHKFEGPIRAWCAGVTAQATKDVIQFELLGPNSDMGTGMIPKDSIVKTIRKPGVAEAVETVQVRHADSDCSCKYLESCSKCKISELTFKTYDQGRDSFQGTKIDVIWLDEEPRDQGIFTECLTRTACGPGEYRMIYCTFTPLFGISDVVMKFLPDGMFPPNGVHPETPYRYIATATWDDVPHLSEEWKAQALAAYAAHEREARTKGIPSLGAGAIYPYADDDIVVPDFQIPPYWRKCYGLDVGWNRTAAVWLATNPDTGVSYVYSQHYKGQEVVPIHASAIKSRGAWIPGAIDPASEGRNQADGVRLIDLYGREGLNLMLADNSVEAGLQQVSHLFSSDRLKIFASCKDVIAEKRIYRRDEKGHIVKKNDHAMDALRYAVMTGLEMAITEQEATDLTELDYISSTEGRDNITGY